MFLRCDVFGSLWQLVKSWIGLTGVDPNNISDHFFQFIHYTGHSKKRRSFLQLLWLLCVWQVWNEHNNRIFNNIQTPIMQLLDRVKYHSFWRLIMPLSCTVLIDGGRTLWSVWVSTNCVFVIITLDWLFLGMTSLVHLVLGMTLRCQNHLIVMNETQSDFVF